MNHKILNMEKSLINRHKKTYLFILFMVVISFFSCGKSGGVAPEEDLKSTAPPSTVPAQPPSQLPSDGSSFIALVYGSSASDRIMLENRINGYQAPGLAEVFQQWRRISGNTIYNTEASIPTTPSYCFTSLDSNYNWVAGTNPSTGLAIYPGISSDCVNSASFTSKSWSFIPRPDRLYNATNSTNFIGFLSGLKFETFNFEAVVSSADTDDDTIGLIIAAYVDASNMIHSLSAIRTQGGNQPTQGWAIVYRQNNNIIRIFDEKSVGGTNRNGVAGDRLGWNGRNTKIRIERNGNIIKAYTSTWGSSGTVNSLSTASEISIDLSDTTNGLTIFQGEQYYGYGSMSQLGANFSQIDFETPNAEADPSYIYDLHTNSVYIKNVNGGYNLMSGVQAFTTIGYPKRVKNTETQKEFMINSATGYTDL
jgi:hypothetical protein